MLSSKNQNGVINVIWSNIDSSSVEYIHYNYDGYKGNLGVRFTSGQSYIYDSVPMSAILSLLKAESVGSAFSKLIRTSYPYKNVGNCGDESPLTKIGI